MSSAEASPSFSTTTMENARKAKVSMEQFYENLLIQDRDRTNRWRKLELSMEEMALVEEEVRTQGAEGVVLASSLCVKLVKNDLELLTCGGIEIYNHYLWEDIDYSFILLLKFRLK